MISFLLKKLTALLLLVAVLWAPLHSAYGCATAAGDASQYACSFDSGDGCCPDESPDHDGDSCDHDECCSMAEPGHAVAVIPFPRTTRLSWNDVPVYLPNVFLPIFVPPES